ncbi:hypothetical protein H696_00980 [Fonticula alba]|uniref:HD/PDEase domain-containing protein n=1 Tax=Fonticula alba TaxID=691883 RepID=A0A058ZGF5_FONAL|nr:hypothetical protein H696_00980 [Fonticula alba]KCV73444.1 hypothetical protein H696_00980 [Fonticula alba]|eukprot:XP_009493145.1 hypothetical protein H696_00980 [Fonticula alba]
MSFTDPSTPIRSLTGDDAASDGSDYNVNPYRSLNDNIHGQYRLPKKYFDIIDTEQFQRLRNLMQLGCAYYVFPSASHNRFEHSLGVGYLANTLLGRLQREQRLDFDNPRQATHLLNSVTIAGLCHDLGHGPFSHVFDGQFIPRARPGCSWTHEDASEMMLDDLVDKNYIDIDGENGFDVELIKELIQGQRSAKFQHIPRYIYQIVANESSGVDVDKFDYINRDCHNVGLKTSYDFGRLMDSARVVNDEITFPQKEVFNLYEMFHTRYSLFKRIYTHRVGTSIEYMVVDAMLLADQALGISSSIDRADTYLSMTDSVLDDIVRAASAPRCSANYVGAREAQCDGSKVSSPEELARSAARVGSPHAQQLAEARGIIRNIRQRNHYRFVGELFFSREIFNKLKKTPNIAGEIASFGSSNSLAADDVVVDFSAIHYGMRDQNPVERIKFYNRLDINKVAHIPQIQVSPLIPKVFEECRVRVFARRPDNFVHVQTALAKWVKHCYPQVAEEQLNFALMAPPDYTPSRSTGPRTPSSSERVHTSPSVRRSPASASSPPTSQMLFSEHNS